MLAQQTMQDAIAQNIANANTVGYKQDNPTFRALHGMALKRLSNGTGSGPAVGELGVGVANDKTYIDWQPGALTQTGGALDASLDTGQFFAVRTPRGERYTRAGDFRLDGAGNLLSSSGLPVLDANSQPINTGGRGQLGIDAVGNLTSDGKPIARLRIMAADANGLAKDGDSLFRAVTPAAVRPAARPHVNSGMLEQSNVNPVESLVTMITVTRGFDMAQRAITTQDELLRHATNDLGHL